jgi:hypothetical protein
MNARSLPGRLVVCCLWRRYNDRGEAPVKGAVSDNVTLTQIRKAPGSFGGSLRYAEEVPSSPG